ncbi:MAG: hypothetical protein ILP22_09675 [Oscillospiraceae bacterium]|nr:hypothetical protein [Oscillospiraceae bacterium]
MHKNIFKAVTLAFCASLALCSCGGGDNDESDREEVNLSEAVSGTSEAVSGTVSETVLPVSETSGGADTSAVSEVVSENVSGTAIVSESVKTAGTSKAAQTARVPETEKPSDPAPVPREGNKPDTYIDPSEYGYSDEQLCMFALNRYGSVTNHRPDNIVIEGEENGVVTIHLYDEHADNITTCSWYYTDRMTGKTTDILGNEFYITEPGADLWNPQVPQRAQIKENDWCAVRYIGLIFEDTIVDYISHNVAYQEFGLQHEDYEWLMHMPKLNHVKTDGARELYLIIPRDDEAQVTVTLRDGSEKIYHSFKGAPFLLACNTVKGESNVNVSITDNSGEHPAFSPLIHENSSGKVLSDFEGATALSEYPVIGYTMADDE